MTRTALVTGSTSGIGEAIARTLAADGIHVVVSGRRPERGEAVVAGIRDAGGRADFVAVDLTAPAPELRTFAQTVLNVVGELDILVNNAGVYPATLTEDLADADLDAMLFTNLRAPHVLVGACAPAMAERGHGNVVNIGSWMGKLGSPYAAFYSSTKAAIEQMTRNWAAEYGPRGVRVNGVAPGATSTPGNADAADILAQMTSTTPAGEPVSPQDIADAVSFLVSDRARMVQGTTVDVDGGITHTRMG